MRPYIEYRHGNDPERDELESHLSAITYFAPTKTIQDAEDTDINAMMKRFGVHDGSVLPGRDNNVADPRYYGQWDDSLDHRMVLDIHREANERFNALPAAIRSRFKNNPNELWNWVQQPENLEEAVKMGLLHVKSLEGRTPPTPPPGTSAPEPPPPA